MRSGVLVACLSVGTMLYGASGCVGDAPTPSGGPGPDGMSGDANADVGAGEGAAADAGAIDADAGAAPCLASDPILNVALVGGTPGINTAANELWAALSQDELEIFVQYTSSNNYAIGTSKRAKLGDPFAPLAPVTGATFGDGGNPNVSYPALSPDGRFLYVEHQGGMYVTTRMNTTMPFTDMPTFLSGYEGAAFYFATEKRLWYSASVDGGPAREIRWAGRNPMTGQLTGSTPVPELTAAVQGKSVGAAVLTPDETTIYFATGMTELNEIWVATRTDASSPFATAKKIDAIVNADGKSRHPTWVSPDNCRLYFVENGRLDGLGARDVWVASRK